MANKNKQGVAETFDASQSSDAFFSKNKKVILGSVAALVLIVAGFFLYKSLVAGPREEKASTALAKGQEYFNQEQFDKALNGDGAGYVGFARIADDYSSTDAGNLANLYVGLCYAHQEKPNWTKALEYVQKFSTSNDQIISPASQMALGDIYANNNQNDKAVESFKKAADMANAKGFEGINLSVAPLALRKAGIILESEGKKADALKLYQEIKTKYVTSPMYQDIDKYIERASN